MVTHFLRLSAPSAVLLACCLPALAILSVAKLGDAREALYLVPWPKTVGTEPGMMSLTDHSRIVVAHKELLPLGKILSDEIFLAVGMRLQAAEGEAKDGDIALKINRDLKGQAYTLTVADHGVVDGADYNAAALGTVTLLQAIGGEDGKASLPHLTIKDQPRFEYCGAMLDVVRKPYSLDTLRQCITICRFYKIRFLHLHLSDENAWVFPSTAYPTLGSQNFAWAGGEKPAVYKLADLKELVAFADARGVTLVPELEMPGHSGQMRGTLPEIFGYKDEAGKTVTPGVLNMISEESFKALDTLVGEMSDVFASSPYFHIGCDEASIAEVEKLLEVTAFLAKNNLTGTHAVFNAFVNRMHGIVKKHGKRMIVWEGAALDPVAPPKDVVFMPWVGHSDAAAELVKRGYSVINAPWGTPAPILDPFLVNGAQLKKDEPLLLGATSILWESTEDKAVPYLRQTGALRNEPTYNPDAGRDHADFLRRLHVADARLNRLLNGFTFATEGVLDPRTYMRLDAVFPKTMTVTLQTSLPPDRIRYTVDGSEPTATSPAYKKPISMRKTTTLIARSFDAEGKTPLATFTREYRKVPALKHDAVGAAVTVSPERPGYFGPGPKGLTDGFLADGDEAGSAGWVGWEASQATLEITVDLGKSTKITRLGAHCLRAAGGIFLPKSVEFAVSEDGKEYRSVATVDQQTGDRRQGWYIADLKDLTARFVRLHPTPGGDWTFLDEVVVNPELPGPTLRHAALGKPATLVSPPHSAYSAPGVEGLTDGHTARSPDFMNPQWLGIMDKDVDATIDLGEAIEIHTVGANFLQYVRAGIFIPATMNILVSDDGKEFRTVATATHKRDDQPAYIKSLSADLKDVKARYVRIVAATAGAWLFVDEVFVNPKADDEPEK